MKTQITGLYAADSPAYIGARREASGINKLRLDSAMVDGLGIQGDIQVDKRYHGGPERALHQYALSGYERIIKRFPLLHRKALPGSIGENLSAPEMNDSNVYIGDIYRFGKVKLQVSSPRMPCWKIDEKLGQPGLQSFIRAHQITGWYFRVIEAGKLHQGDTVELLERSNDFLSVATLVRCFIDRQSNKALSDNIKLVEGLDPEWREKFA